MKRSPSPMAQQLPRSHPRNRGQEARGRGAPAPAASRRQPRPAIPGWLWLIAGLGAGILITSLVKLSAVPTPEAAATANTAAEQAAPPAAAEPAAATDADAAAVEDSAPGTRFDFYTLLPEREVIVPDQHEVASTPPPPAGSPPAADQVPTPPAAPTPPPAAVPGETYVLQAGSFRGSAEAERRRAQIQALGLNARVESVAANGDTWYRVQAGPFTSADTLASARNRLSGAGIETLLLRRRPAP